MQRRRVILFILSALVALVFVIGAGIGFIIPRWLSLVARPSVYNTSDVLLQVQTVSELVTVKYIMEKVVILEDVKWIAGLGENRVLLLAHGMVKAGIDLSKLEEGDFRVDGRKVVIRLPPARITEAYLDDRQTKVIERSTGLLRMFDKDLEQAARQTAVEDIRRAARTGGILDEADTRAKAQLTALLKQLGFQQVEFVRR